MEKPPSGTNAPEGEEDPRVTLNVGGFSYTTTRSVLMNPHHEEEDEKTYFHALLADRWTKKQKTTNDPDQSTERVVNIPDREGDIFFYVLYYLRVGQLPRDPASPYQSFDTLLTSLEVSRLLNEADFYGLHGLAEQCRKTQDLLRGFSRSTGDLDLSSYSDFRWKVEEEDCDYQYDLKYKCNGNEVGADVYHSCVDCTWSVSVAREPGDTYVNKDIYVATFRELQGVVSKLCDEEKEPTVCEVLSKVGSAIALEARLWWAFHISAMIEWYKKNRTWDALGDSKDAALHFLWYIWTS